MSIQNNKSDHKITTCKKSLNEPLAEPILGSSLIQPTSGFTPIQSNLPHTQFQLMNIIRSILRFKWTAIIIFILVSVPPIIGIWKFTHKKYQAHGMIRIRPIIPRLVFKTEDNGTIPFYSSFVNTQIALIRDHDALNRVYDNIATLANLDDTKNTPEYKTYHWLSKPHPSFKEWIFKREPVTGIELIKDNLLVRPRPKTEIIDITFTAPDGDYAKIIIDTILDDYRRNAKTNTSEDSEKVLEQLKRRRDDLASQIKNNEIDLIAIQDKLKTNLPDELIASKRLRLDQLESDYDKLVLEIDDLKIQKAQLEDPNFIDDPCNVLNTLAKADPTTLKFQYHEDTEWRSLNIEYKRAIHQLDMARKRYTKNNPILETFQDEVDFAKELVAGREKQLDDLWDIQTQRQQHTIPHPTPFDQTDTMTREQKLLLINNDIYKKKEMADILYNKFNDYRANFLNLFTEARELKKIQRENRLYQELFDAVNQRIKQKEVEQNNTIGSIETFKAFPINKPRDRRLTFTIMALCFGFSLGCGIAFLRSMQYQMIHTPKEIMSIMQTPFLGNLPLVSADVLAGRQENACLDEYARMVRTALMSRLGIDDKGKAILLSSASENTGKSHTTVILGRSLARIGKKVLLLDADLRRKGLTRILGYDNKPGLIESFNSNRDHKTYIYVTDTPSMSFIPAGQNLDQIEIEKMANGIFSGFLNVLRSMYDIIILDGTPILPVADARIFCSQVDGTVMVEREDLSKKSDVIDALETLNNSGGSLLGTIFIGDAKHSVKTNYYSYHDKALPTK